MPLEPARLRQWLGLGALLLGALLAAPGCMQAEVDTADLLIVSPWPEEERARLEEEYQRWREHAPGATTGACRIAWYPLAMGDDPAGVVRWRPAVDVVLGGPATVFERLAESGRLAPIEPGGRAGWRVSRTAPIGLAINTAVSRVVTPAAEKGSPRPPEATVVFDDPRHDPIALAWAREQLGADGWSEGYARLVESVGHPRRVGRLQGAALAAVERGEAALTPAVAPLSTTRRSIVFVPASTRSEWREGVAILSAGRHLDRSREFLRFLADRGQADPPPSELTPAAGSDGLLAELLGATLVDAQDECWTAWSALRLAGRPERLEIWMTQPPPWPPASIEKILQQDASGALLDTLVEQVTPDASLRAWLVRSWLGPPRLFDGALLDELAGAEEGRLAREPRFRAWLRAEWTAWARQRYRRVARESTREIARKAAS